MAVDPRPRGRAQDTHMALPCGQAGGRDYGHLGAEARQTGPPGWPGRPRPCGGRGCAISGSVPEAGAAPGADDDQSSSVHKGRVRRGAGVGGRQGRGDRPAAAPTPPPYLRRPPLAARTGARARPPGRGRSIAVPGRRPSRRAGPDGLSPRPSALGLAGTAVRWVDNLPPTPHDAMAACRATWRRGPGTELAQACGCGYPRRCSARATRM